jgi:hypothetical protein
MKEIKLVPIILRQYTIDKLLEFLRPRRNRHLINTKRLISIIEKMNYD